LITCTFDSVEGVHIHTYSYGVGGVGVIYTHTSFRSTVLVFSSVAMCAAPSSPNLFLLKLEYAAWHEKEGREGKAERIAEGDSLYTQAESDYYDKRRLNCESLLFASGTSL